MSPGSMVRSGAGCGTLLPHGHGTRGTATPSGRKRNRAERPIGSDASRYKTSDPRGLLVQKVESDLKVERAFARYFTTNGPPGGFATYFLPDAM